MALSACLQCHRERAGSGIAGVGRDSGCSISHANCVQALLDMALELCGRYIQPYHTQEAAATVILQVCETGVAEGLALPENMVSQIQAVLGPNLRPAVRPFAPLPCHHSRQPELHRMGMAWRRPFPAGRMSSSPPCPLQQHPRMPLELGPLAGG